MFTGVLSMFHISTFTPFVFSLLLHSDQNRCLESYHKSIKMPPSGAPGLAAAVFYPPGNQTPASGHLARNCCPSA
jgi:hypothetical protein